jgi:hypothetical protein
MELLGCSAMARGRWCGRSAAAQRTLRGGAGRAGTARVLEVAALAGWGAAGAFKKAPGILGGRARRDPGEDCGRDGAARAAVAEGRGRGRQVGPWRQRAWATRD